MLATLASSTSPLSHHLTARSNKATFYIPSNGACSGSTDSTKAMVAELSTDMYGDKEQVSLYCSSCASVKDPKVMIVVRIVDACST